MRSSALQEMTSSELLLSLQSASEREQLARTKYYMDLVIREAGYAEILPLNERAQNNPIIGLGSVAQRDGTYTWERWQSVLPALSRVIREELLATQQILTKQNQ